MDTTVAENIKETVDEIYEAKFKVIVEQAEPDFETLNISGFQEYSNTTNKSSKDDLWIFGYGSLIWKADFPYIEKRTGFINGFLRRFYQHSTDHRGNRIRPGRVVTLISASPIDCVYGVAYRVSAADKDSVLKQLDYREKNGYQRCTVEFHEYPQVTSTKTNTLQITVYIATPENESWAGDKDDINLRNIVKQIVTSTGDSGTNRQYLFNLANSMKTLFPEVVDDHIEELLKAVLEFIKTEEPKLLESLLKQRIYSILNTYNYKTLQNYQPINVDILEHSLNLLRVSCSLEGWRELLYSKIPLNDI